MTSNGLLALLSGGVNGYEQGRQDYQGRRNPVPKEPLTSVYAGEVTMRPGFTGPVPGRYQPLPTLPMAPAPMVPLTPRKLPPIQPIAVAPPRLIRRRYTGKQG